MNPRPKAKAGTQKSAPEAVPLPKGPWVVYALKCHDGSLYCGITNDLERRIRQHEEGTGARYTRGRAPLHLAGFLPQANRAEASKSEAAFKKLSRTQKLRAIASWPLPGSNPLRRPRP